jgi:hypothetical protein
MIILIHQNFDHLKDKTSH